MKRKIYVDLCFISVIAVVVSAVLTLYAFYGFFSDEVKSQLQSEAMVFVKSMEYNGRYDGDYINSLRYDEDIRITLILSDGTVSYDTDADYRTMVNHNDRPEVIEARENGFGTDIRKSDTIGQDTYYYATLLSDGAVFRASKQLNNIAAVFIDIFPVIFGIILFVLLICFWLSSVLTKKLLKPVLTATSDVNILHSNTNHGEIKEYYEELEPFYRKIRWQNEQINQYIDRLKQERDTIDTITGHMKEGLVIIDKERNILSLNKSAIHLLGAMDGVHYTGINIMALYRNIEFNSHVKQAVADGINSDLVIRTDKRSCRFFISPVYEKQEISGAVILVVDVTQQEKAEQVRREFSANVSHELKTPLTSINGFAEMIANGMAKDTHDIQKFAGLICTEAKRLIRIINDIIRLSEIEEAQKESEMMDVDLRLLADEVVKALQYAAFEKNITLLVKGDELSLKANPRMMEEMIYNLVENAIKYNKPGGSVTVMVSSHEKFADITVSDTGIGISPKHQDRIFERFYRVDKSRSNENGATGLGLSIVKHAAEYHAGTITLKSEENIGTEITVTLPR